MEGVGHPVDGRLTPTVAKRRPQYMTLLMRDKEQRDIGMAKGAAKQLVNDVDRMVSELDLTVERACEIANVTVQQYEDARKLLEQE